MKTIKKLFKWAFILFGAIIALVIVVAIFSGDDEEVSTGTKTEVSTTSKTDQKAVANEKKFNAGISKTFGGMIINIAEVKVTEDKIVIGMNFENSTTSKLSFYPDQGSAIIGSMQLSANMFMGSGEISGDINSKVKMDGTIEYLAPEGKKIDVKNIKEIKLDMGDIYNESTYDAVTATIAIPVK
ncbi:hypothetical protein J7E63_15895 [Bacillus sp. ISL-75]|uniref:hypothetical protein n=1 Tax=Bacillus sp. ISL-75 TaxID=2819137 RepID=UPI001BE7F9E8|nr:hypothetical protein [Bacillus sp. ISL-75]MBT2728412.1 hypothetical protein [Bacillus sp. ISL-75]